MGAIMNAGNRRCLVITGASSGIGRAAAHQFREAGFEVFNLSRRSCDVAGVENVAVDLSVPGWSAGVRQSLSPLFDEPRPITLVHNAARTSSDSLGALDIGDFRSVLELNVTAAVELGELLLPAMRGGSSILYVGSTLSEKAVKGAFSYVTTKHAVVGLMRATCQDLAGRGIHTACICPGFTDTEMLRQHVPDPAVLTAIGTNNAFGRLVEPAEIAGTLLFAAENPVINGSVIHAGLGQIET